MINWVALEERLRAVEGNNLIQHVIAADVCLVLNIMVLKEFRVSDFVKYIGLECPYTHLQSYYNKMAEMIHNDKMLIESKVIGFDILLDPHALDLST